MANIAYGNTANVSRAGNRYGQTPSIAICFNTVLSVLMLMSVGLDATAGEGTCQVTELRCEYQQNPLGIDTGHPRLSWIIKSDRRGWRQTAFQILVSRSRETLSRHMGEIWDSGKVDSSRSIQHRYAGKPLATQTQYFWKVRVWDNLGQPSPWSDVATWTCALLHEADWRAKWIQRPSAEHRSLTFAGTKWIWHDEPIWHTTRNQQTPPNAPGGQARLFQKPFKLPSDAHVVKAKLIALADNRGDVWLNGRHVVTPQTWQTATVQDVTSLLVPGMNLLSARVTNLTNDVNPAGFLAKLMVEMDNHPTLQVGTDSSWRSSDQQAFEGWQHKPQSNWNSAVSVANWGDAPWGNEVNIREQQLLPLFRKQFSVSKPIRRALLHVSGLGHYKLWLNGQSVGNRFLDPAWSVYEKTVYYTTYDLTTSLKSGPNTLGVMLGKGFYDTAGDRRIHFVDVSRPLKLILQADIQYEDGSSECVITDSSWLVTEGPITHCAILGGSDYDARRLPAGWCENQCDERVWSRAQETTGPGGRLRASEMPPMINAAEFQTTRIDQVQPGVFVYDFGQNASARPRLHVQGQAGQTIRLTPAEQRFGQTDRTNDGSGRVNQAGVGSPNYWEYTLRGGEPESWCPPFTYSGFQYLELTGGVPAGQPNPDSLPVVTRLESVHVRNGSPTVGDFECSQPLLNDVNRMIDWAVRSNLAHVLTDCPHREKLGWLEVSYLMGPSIASRYDISRFYAKVTRDIRESQDSSGKIYTVAPHYPRFPAEDFSFTPEWGAAGVVLPWQLYQWYGDQRVLAENFDAMKRYVDFLRQTSTDLIAEPGLGDWYDYGHGQPAGPSRFTPPELTATAIFYHCTQIVARTAHILGRTSDHDGYQELAKSIQDRYLAEFYGGQGEFTNHGSPQTANAMSLVVGLVTDDQREQVLNRIVSDLAERGFQQTAGDVGFHFLVEALAQNGRSDVLFRMINRHSKGSYGFIVDRDWTSMPEAWDVNTSASLNHLMLGHIQQWFYQDLLGIRNAPTSQAFRHSIIRPQIVGDLTWVTGHFDSMYGRIAVQWRREQDRLELALTVPANTSSTVHLPVGDASWVTENGNPLDVAKGIDKIRPQGNELLVDVSSGSYRFQIVREDRK